MFHIELLTVVKKEIVDIKDFVLPTLSGTWNGDVDPSCEVLYHAANGVVR